MVYPVGSSGAQWTGNWQMRAACRSADLFLAHGAVLDRRRTNGDGSPTLRSFGRTFLSRRFAVVVELLNQGAGGGRC